MNVFCEFIELTNSALNVSQGNRKAAPSSKAKGNLQSKMFDNLKRI